MTNPLPFIFAIVPCKSEERCSGEYQDFVITYLYHDDQIQRALGSNVEDASARVYREKWSL